MVELDRPPPGLPKGAVTDHDLEQDGQSFMAFASAFGIAPPTGGRPALPEGVPSLPSA